jgi:acetylornithine deacetylase
MTPRHGALAEARAGDPVALTRILVAIPSVNPDLEPDGAGEPEVAAVCADLLQGWGLETRTYDATPGRPNVVAELAGDGPTLLLNGHLDTVGVAGMTIDPFGAEIRGDRLWGRGACDMKGGVAALMAATHALAKSPVRPNIVVALTSDEENASVGMAELVRRGVQADLAVVCEPTQLAVMPAHKGFVWIRTRFQGRAAHGSRPDLGIDAIRHAARFLARLDEHEEELRARPPHALLGHGSFHGGTIRGGVAASVYPELCEVVLERRTLPGEDGDTVVAPFERALAALRDEDPDVTAELDVTLERPGTEVASDTPLVRGLLAALDASGHDARVEGMTAWVDAAYLNEAGIPAVCFGPGSIEQAHTADEWVDVGQLRSCASVLERFARGLVQGGTGG